jgi:hypothetical protein
MKRMRTLCLTGLLWMMTCILYAQNQLITYTVPGDGVELKDDFTVRVRQSGSGWKEVVTYPVKVDEVRQTKHHVELASMGYFDFSGQVEVSVSLGKRFTASLKSDIIKAATSYRLFRGACNTPSLTVNTWSEIGTPPKCCNK